jgi:hypothetical protein
MGAGFSSFLSAGDLEDFLDSALAKDVRAIRQRTRARIGFKVFSNQT